MNDLRTKINFYCVGAQKAGTTTLHDILRQHPDVFLPLKKEAHFFDMDERFEKGMDWYYNEFFKEYKNEKVCGVCNPEYMYFEDVAKRLFDAHGKSLKLIFIFRNPVDRAFSHYLMSKRRLKEELSFEDAIAQEEVRVVHNYQSKTDFSYISRGFYAEQVKRFLKYFPIENIFFIRFEDDFILNRKEVIQELLQFLNIENIDLDVNLKSNKAKEAKYPLLQFVLYGENFIKKPLKLIPKNAKNKLKKKS